LRWDFSLRRRSCSSKWRLAAEHPITNPTIVIGTIKAIAIMAYAPNRVAPGTSAATAKIANAAIRAFHAYLFICFSSVPDEEIIMTYDALMRSTSPIKGILY